MPTVVYAQRIAAAVHKSALSTNTSYIVQMNGPSSLAKEGTLEGRWPWTGNAMNVIWLYTQSELRACFYFFFFYV